MTILGVDLGTTNSLAVVYKEGKPVLIPNGTMSRKRTHKIDKF